MSKKLSTTLTLAVTALKNLEERKGASPHDICNYISSVYNVPKDVAKRKALVALKRGTSYGLLKETCGRYNLSTDTEKECLELTNQELGLLNLNCRKRRLERKRRLRGSSKQTVKGKISRRKKSLTPSNSRKSSRGKRNKSKKKKKRKGKGKSISKSINKKRTKRSRSRGKNSTIKRGKSCVCPPGGNRTIRKSKSRSTSRSRKKKSKSNSRRSRSRKSRPKGKRITKSANKLTSKSRSKSRSKTRSRSRSKSKSKTRKRSRSKSKSKSRKKSRSKSTNKGRTKKTGKSKNKKKRSTSCECPTNPARKIVPKSTGNDNQKTDKSQKIKKEKKQKKVKKDKENKEPKKDNCLYHFLGVSSGNLMDTRLNHH